MSDRPIGFLDSGIGGIPYLLAARSASPSRRYVYYADNLNFPYGDRPVDEVRRIVVAAVSRLIEVVDPALIVVACNTASVVGLDELRGRFELPFVGVVPAIKPAAEIVQAKRIGVLATSRTVRDPYVSDLIRRFAFSSLVELVAADSLVRLIEDQLGTVGEAELREAVRQPVERLLESGVEAIVLGCTHFVHVRGIIETMAGEAISVIDSVDGVVRQMLRLAGPDNPGAPPATPRLVLSDPSRAGAGYRYLVSAYGFVRMDTEKSAPKSTDKAGDR